MSPVERDLPTSISDSSLTSAERATLSNTICGDVVSSRSLERLGLIKIRRLHRIDGETLAFFDLTEAGEEHVRRHYVVAEVPEAL